MTMVLSVLLFISASWQKITAKKPDYCQTIVAENPSLKDLEETWQKEPAEFYCSGSDGLTTVCEKKRARSLAAVKKCY